MKNIDFIIVGQGIAGTLLCHELEKRQQSFIVIDDGKHNASQTCAGMINPVVLKRFAPVWQAREQITQARETFAELESKLTKKLFYPFNLYRIFNNKNESATWLDKSILPELHGLLDTELSPSFQKSIVAPYGMGKVSLCGRMDVYTLIDAYRQHLVMTNAYLQEKFDHTKLFIENSIISYNGIVAKNIIFCEGYGVKQNSLFNYLPLNGNKGETIIAKIPNLAIDATIKSDVFIMPLPDHGDDVYFIGSTYNWTDKDHIPSDAAKTELLQKLQKIITHEIYEHIEIIKHYAAIRPTVSDRRPLLGSHSIYNNIFILNGLGTRGVMLGATMAKHLTSYIFDNTELPENINITRFDHLLKVHA